MDEGEGKKDEQRRINSRMWHYFHMSRALTHPLRCNPMSHRLILG